MKGTRIATVYRADRYDTYPTHNMAFVRWLRLSVEFARLGASVDMVVDVANPPRGLPEGLRVVRPRDVMWADYDVVKAHYQRGFETLERLGGASHPYVLSSLATVVGPDDHTPGVQVVPEDRAALWAVQERIARGARRVSVRTPGNAALWSRQLGDGTPPLVVPTGVDERIPPPGPDPYAAIGRPVVVYVGNLRRIVPGHLNRLWIDRLQRLASLLTPQGIEVCYVGPTPREELGPGIHDLGAVENDRIWDFKRHASVGLALAEGPEQLNESSKIYYYLRAGLPVVCEHPIPNRALLASTGLGTVVPYGDVTAMASAVERTLQREWPRAAAVKQMLATHTWRHRARTYADALARGA